MSKEIRILPSNILLPNKRATITEVYKIIETRSCKDSPVQLYDPGREAGRADGVSGEERGRHRHKLYTEPYPTFVQGV